MNFSRLWLAALLGCVGSISSAQVVISQVYGAGGNSGATLNADYVELFNRGTTAQSLAGWSVQYAATTGSSWSRTDLVGPNINLQPGQYYLIRMATGANGSPIATFDQTGSLSMAAGAGKVALVTNTTTLTGACPTGGIQDFVGYGPLTNCSETAPTSVNLSATTAAFRGSNGCTDAGNNSTDFSTAAPSPRNSTSALNACSGGLPTLSISSVSVPEGNSGTTSMTFTVTASAVPSSTISFNFATADGTATLANNDYLAISGTGSISSPNNSTTVTVQILGDTVVESDETLTLNITGVTGAAPSSLSATGTITNDDSAPAGCTPTHTISQIQGSGQTSPLVGQTGISTTGIVTAVRTTGFFVQEPTITPGSTSSQGLFVFLNAALPSSAAVGNSVCVSGGAIVEFRRANDPTPYSVTELDTTAANVSLVASGQPIPAAIDLTTALLDTNGALDQLERFEGMRVRLPDSVAVGATAGFGEVVVTRSGVNRPFREPGIIAFQTPPTGTLCAQSSQVNPGQSGCIPKWDGSPEKIVVDSDGLAGQPSRSYAVGANLGEVFGPLHFDFASYRILPENSLPVIAPPAEVPVPVATADKLTVANFNVENFTVASGTTKRTKLNLAIRNVLRNPDVIGFQEVENLAVLQTLAGEVNTSNAGSTNYQAYLIVGNDAQRNVGFLVNTTRVTVNNVQQFGLTDTFDCGGNSGIVNDRPPLVLTATLSAGGGAVPLTFKVISNHLRSFIDIESTAPEASCPGQTAGFRVRLKRAKQAEYLAQLVQGFQAAGDRVIVLGDMNAYEFNDGYVDSLGTIKGTPAAAGTVVLPTAFGLVSPPIVNLVESIPAPQRYSYVIGGGPSIQSTPAQGSAQVIDHILVTQNLMNRNPVMTYARMDADYPEFLRSDVTTPRRVSDHDPSVMQLQLPTMVLQGQATVTRLAFNWSTIQQRWIGQFRITNTGSSAIAAPVQFCLTNLSVGTIFGGVTSAVGPCRTLTSPIAAGASVNVSVAIMGTFNSTTGAPIPTFLERVYSGGI
jgi:uncharacterized protein